MKPQEFMLSLKNPFPHSQKVTYCDFIFNNILEIRLKKMGTDYYLTGVRVGESPGREV